MATRIDPSGHTFNLSERPGRPIRPIAVDDITRDCDRDGSTRVAGGPIYLAYGWYNGQLFVNVQDGTMNQHIAVNRSGRAYHSRDHIVDLDSLFEQTASLIGIEPQKLDRIIKRGTASL